MHTPKDKEYYFDMIRNLGADESIVEHLAKGMVAMQTRGHFPNWPPKLMAGGKKAEVLCEFCDATLWVVANPAPNEIHVSGDAFGKSCKVHPEDQEDWLDIFQQEEGE